jgi:8-oxo-dGTP pyrophosphatase MutT (NUDIX family)
MSSPGAIRRRTARVLPVDPEGRVLLLHGWDPHHPERPFWFTVGGAAEDGESLRDAAVRELYEETRIAVDPAELGEPIAEHGWLAAAELEDGERPAHPDIPDLIRAAAASVLGE